MKFSWDGFVIPAHIGSAAIVMSHESPRAEAPALSRQHGSALLGRETERRTFLAWLDSAKHGAGIAAVIVGVPGIGKSALLREMRKLALAAGADVRDLTGSGSLAAGAHQTTVLFADGIAAGDVALRARALAFARQIRYYAAVLVVTLDAGDPLLRELAFEDVQQLRLGGLADSDVAQLLAGHGKRNAAACERAFAQAGGNPRHAVELLDAWPPRSIGRALDAIRTGADASPSSAVCALAVTADDRHRIDLRAARHVHGGAHRELERALAALRRERLVVGDEFVDGLTRRCAEKTLGSAARKAASARAAAWLLTAAARREIPDLDRLARRARLLRVCGNYGDAAAEYIVLADANRNGNRIEAMRDAYAAALHCEERDGRPKLQTLTSLSRAHGMLGDLTREIEIARRAIALLEASGAAHETLDHLLVLAHRAHVLGERELHDRALTRLQRFIGNGDVAPASLPGVLLMAGLLLSEHRPDEAGPFLNLVLARANELSPAQHTHAVALRAIILAVYANASDVTHVRNRFKEALSLAERYAYPENSSLLWHNYGLFEFSRGKVTEAKAALGTALSLALARGNAIDALRHRVDIGWIAVVQGERERAETILTDPGYTAGPSEIRCIRAWPAACLATLLQRGEFFRREEAEHLAMQATHMNDRDRHVRALGALALILHATGETDRLEATADLAIAAVSQAFDTFDVVALIGPFGSAATAERGRALLAALTRTHDSRIACGMTALFEALLAARSNRVAQAQRHAAVAAHAFTALRWHAFALRAARLSGDERAVAEIERRLGVATGRSHAAASPLDHLTQRQRFIAERLAGGAKNEDLAVELGIATSTVEKHVAAVLQRLGLRSRHEVRRILQAPQQSLN